VKFVQRIIGEIVRYLLGKKNFACLLNCGYCADRAQNVPGSRPKCARNRPPKCTKSAPNFTPKRLIFVGVIVERVNTAKSHLKANPIFGGSLASSRITLLSFWQHCCRRSLSIEYVRPVAFDNFALKHTVNGDGSKTAKIIKRQC